jgi:hypothetical protein
VKHAWDLYVLFATSCKFIILSKEKRLKIKLIITRESLGGMDMLYVLVVVVITGVNSSSQTLTCAHAIVYKLYLSKVEFLRLKTNKKNPNKTIWRSKICQFSA